LFCIDQIKETYIRSGAEEGLDDTVKEGDIEITAKVENTLLVVQVEGCDG
jgi:hypothetical protein